MEGGLHVGGIQRRRLHEGEPVPLGKVPCLFCLDGTQVAQVALVTHQHDDDISVRVLPQLPQPPLGILKALMLCNVIDEQCPDGAPIVPKICLGKHFCSM